ncbi:glycoside hydrolase family 88/105 protein [Occallatibacter savannae]|uniref:glycoside hydrolase family 88/105 protein n=1 Tax=Occallatibacter savannae TaxID=1002691 RepID=UPI000D68C056|nr:glycoside hydrolase family 88 protein [Occallatibacter savannae]
MKKPRLALALALLVLTVVPLSQAQTTTRPPLDERTAAGDQPDDPGPLATGLSPKLKHRDITRAMKLVADWQIKHSEGRYNIDWTYAALYDGLLAASKTTGDEKYHNRVLQVARDYKFQLGPRFAHADDEAVGFTYLTFYSESHEAEELYPTREGMDKLVARPDEPGKNLWWWCDALYMAPKVLAQLSTATSDHRYIDFMDHEWWITSGALYDPAERLYYRDDRYLTQHEANGQQVFWSRGNGWVLAGLAMVLDRMPENYPTRAKYVEQYKQMAERIASLQPADGLWRASLLDPGSYPNPEVSGTAFFTYGLAWGVHHGLLDRKKYLPVAAKSWQGMLTHIYADGRLGSIQPIGAEPGQFKPSSSYVYGLGAFLLAGSELSKIAR